MDSDDKRLKNLTGPQFSSENQPSREAKSKGMKKSWEYRKARAEFYNAMCEIELADGSVVNFWDKVKIKLQDMLFDDESELKEEQKADLMLKLVKELMPEEKQIKVDMDKPLILQISETDSKL